MYAKIGIPGENMYTGSLVAVITALGLMIGKGKSGLMRQLKGYKRAPSQNFVMELNRMPIFCHLFISLP